MSIVFEPTREVRIRFQHPGKPDQIFIEGFLSDDGWVLRTRTVVPPEYAEPWSQRYAVMGLIEAGPLIHTAAKQAPVLPAAFRDPRAIGRTGANAGASIP